MPIDFWACLCVCPIFSVFFVRWIRLQLVWQRYVMTETVSLFFYVLMLLFSFLYLKQRRLWQLAIVQILSVLVISFRMSYLLVVQISAFFLPLIAFLPKIHTAFWKHSSTLSKKSVAKSAGLHLAFSILLMFVLQKAIDKSTGGSRVENLPFCMIVDLASSRHGRQLLSRVILPIPAYPS